MEYWLAERQLEGEGPVGAMYVLHGQEAFLQARFLQLLRQRLFGDDAAAADLNITEIDGAEQGWGAALAAAGTMPFLAERRLVVLRQPPGLAGGGSGGGSSSGGSSGGGSSGGGTSSGGSADASEVDGAAAQAAGGQGTGAKGPAAQGKAKGKADKGQADLEQQLESFLQSPPPSACLAIVASAVDKRRRLYKLLEKHATIVDCVPLKPAEMAGWLRQRTGELGGRITADAAERLAMQIAPDLYVADQELRKLITYAGSEPIDAEAVAAVASKSVEAVIWPLLDAVGQRRPQAALGLARELLQQGEPPLRLLFMITRQWRHLLQCKALSEKGTSQKDIAAALGVPPFAVRNLLGQQRNFTREQLRRGMAQLLETDVQLKSSATEPRLLLEMCIMGLCS